MTPLPSAATRAGFMSPSHTRSGSIPKPANAPADSDAQKAFVEQVRLLVLGMEQRLAAEKGTPDGDEWYEIYHICTSFEMRWVERGPISLADQIYEDVVFEGEICRVGLDYTIVPTSELEGLADILDATRQQTGIEFIAARV